MNESDAAPHFQHVLPAQASSAGEARAFVARVLVGQVPDRVVGDLRLVVSELVSNAVTHGAAATVKVVVDLSDDGWVALEVVGGGDLPPALSDPGRWAIAPVDAVSGRGLGIVRALVDEVATATVDGEVAVRCRMRR